MLSELDSIRKGNHRPDFIKSTASLCLSYIKEEYSKRPRTLFLYSHTAERVDSFVFTEVLSKICNDDNLLTFCCNFQKKKKNVFFISQDVNVRLKSVSKGIESFEFKEFMKRHHRA